MVVAGRSTSGGRWGLGLSALCFGLYACDAVISAPVGLSPAAEVIGEDLAAVSVARRMSNAELDSSLRAILGDTTAPASRRLTDDEFTPFDNNYRRQLVSTALIDSLATMAQDVATALIVSPSRRDALVGCTPRTPGDTECFRGFLSRFLYLAYRRPLVAGEVERFMPLLVYATEENAAVSNDFYTAVGLAIEVVLQDPEFLYRLEIGSPSATVGVVDLTPHEVATRLSFLLWGSAPDRALLDDAGAGRLDRPAGRAAAAVRLLKDQRARAQFRRFHSMWMGYRTIPVDGALAADLAMETNALIDRVLFEDDRSYLDLFTLNETYINASLADRYGLPAPAAPAWVAYGETGRAGILSHGSVLSGFSKFSDTSPTQRGIFIRELLMCDTIPQPPPNVDVDNPPAAETEAACKEERYSQHLRNAACAGCHAGIDPIGFGLENYAIGGMYREHDADNDECVIRGEGALPGYGSFSGPKELSRLLVDNGLLQACVIQRLHEFALGRHLNPAEEGAVELLSATFDNVGLSFQSYLRAYVARDVFAQKRLPPSAGANGSEEY